MASRLSLTVIPDHLVVCRLGAGAPFPSWARGRGFASVTRTADELSVVCREDQAPAQVRKEGPFRAFKVEGPLDFSLTGILASLAEPLARAEISIFALSTFDTDYVLVPAPLLADAAQVLRRAGFEVPAEGR